MLPPLSGRRYQPQDAHAFNGPRGSAADLSVRRKAILKKSFKRLDPLGTGAVKLQEALSTLAAAPMLTPDGLERLKSCFNSAAVPGIDGAPVLTFAAFMSYYVEVSASIDSESDFEQLLEAHWGYNGVSDILAAFQRQLILAGLSVAFQGFGQGVDLAKMSPSDFDACLKRVGLQLRPGDLQRLCGSFLGTGLKQLREELVNPRPETPMPLSRGLPVSLPPAGNTGPNAAIASSPVVNVPGPQLNAPPPVSPSPPSHGDLAVHAALGQMHAELHQLKSQQMSKAGETGPPPQDADLDAALSRLENNLHEIKTHKAKVEAETSKSPPPAPPPVDMPHWEHHKYGHHEIKEPAWQPDKNITDMYGEKHAASEYHYSNFGAGSHGHHLSHFHLNDYHGLAHHSFKAEEYHKQKFGDAAHHGHWVPHLHGIGTANHHGEHSYGKEEYQKETHGASGHHGHWVPHLHGIGDMN